MNAGQGSISFDSKPILSSGPPFAANSAENGLSVENGKIVWGQTVGTPGDPARLLNSREIEINSFNFELKDTANQRFIDIFTGAIDMFDLTGTGNGSINIAARTDNSQFGMSGFANVLGNVAGSFSIANQAFPTTASFAIEHDHLNVFNTVSPAIGSAPLPFLGTLLYPNGNFKVGRIGSTDTGEKFQVSEDALALARFTDLSNNAFFIVDPLTGSYQIGDIDGVANNTFINIDDSLAQINFNSADSVFSGLITAPALPARSGTSSVILKDNAVDQLVTLAGASGTILPVFTSITVLDGIITAIV